MLAPRRRRHGVPARALLWLALGAILSACGVTVDRPGGADEEWMSRAEFRAYAEQVFRRHNRVESELLFLLPELEQENPARYRRLAAAEEEMLAACRALVELAVQRRRGLDIGFFERLGLPPEVTACDRATRRVERLLAE